MRQLVRSIGIWLGVSILSAVPAIAQEVRITDYDVPVSQSHRLELTGEMRLGEPDYGYESPKALYGVGGRWESYYNSLPLAWSVNLYAEWEGRRIRDERLRFGEGALFTGQLREYPIEEGLLFGGGNIRVRWNNRYLRPYVNLGFSVGLGRNVDATALARAIRIEDFLFDEGLLNKRLPKPGLLELASIIDRRGEYSTRYGGTYDVWWYQDMESTIVSSAPLNQSTIGAMGLMRMREVLEREWVKRRAYGWTVQVGIDIPVANGFHSDPGDAQPFAAASLARPLGLKHQIYSEARAASTVRGDFGRYYDFNFSLTYSFEVSNRIDLALTRYYSYFRHLYQGKSYSFQTVREKDGIQLDARYYIENNVSLILWGFIEGYDYRNIDYPDDRLEISERRWTIDLAVGYHVF